MMAGSSAMQVRFGGAKHAAMICVAALSLGCGASPHYVPSPSVPVEPAFVEAEPAPIYIIIQEAEGAPPPAIVAGESKWVPEGLPAENPFDRSRTWVGDYDCVQGNTGFALRIMDVRGRVVRAVFDFHHAPSGAAGKYLISGTYDPDTRHVHFDPSRWIDKPDDYVMVSMEGEVAEDGSLFAGRIPFPGCGAFRLKPTR